MVLGHLTVTAAAKDSLRRLGHPLPGLSMPLLLVGAYLPDLIDKPMAMAFGTSGRGYGHSLVIEGAVFALLWFLSAGAPQGSGFPGGGGRRTPHGRRRHPGGPLRTPAGTGAPGTPLGLLGLLRPLLSGWGSPRLDRGPGARLLARYRGGAGSGAAARHDLKARLRAKITPAPQSETRTASHSSSRMVVRSQTIPRMARIGTRLRTSRGTPFARMPFRRSSKIAPQQRP